MLLFSGRGYISGDDCKYDFYDGVVVDGIVLFCCFFSLINCGVIVFIFIVILIGYVFFCMMVFF